MYFSEQNGEQALELWLDAENLSLRQNAQTLQNRYFNVSLYNDPSDIFFQQQYHSMPNEPVVDERDKYYFDDIGYHEQLTTEQVAEIDALQGNDHVFRI